MCLVVAGSMMWGTVGAAQALSPYAGTPVGLAAARLCLTGMVFGLVAIARHGARLPGLLLRPGCRHLLLAGAGAVGLYQAAFLTAMRESGVAVGSLLDAGSAPLFAGLLTGLAGQRPTRRWLVATALAITGLTLLLAPGGRRVEPLGVAAGLLAGASFATYLWCSRRLLDAGVPSTALLAWLFWAGSVMVLPFAAHDAAGWLRDPDGRTVVAYLVVAATVLPYAMWIRGVATTAPATVATLTLAEPLTATVVGVLVLGESLRLPAGLGVVLLGAGLLLEVTADRRAGVSPRQP